MIYRYKAILPQHKNFIRIYEVRSNSTLYALHLFLQNDLSFSPDMQVFFRTYDNSENQISDYGLFDTGHGSMDQVRLEALHKKGEETLHYVFDIFKGRYLALMFDGQEEERFRNSYPRTILERGGDPDQFREDQVQLESCFEDSDYVSVDEESDFD